MNFGSGTEKIKCNYWSCVCVGKEKKMAEVRESHVPATLLENDSWPAAHYPPGLMNALASFRQIKSNIFFLLEYTCREGRVFLGNVGLCWSGEEDAILQSFV